jgi:hypothetical protein
MQENIPITCQLGRFIKINKPKCNINIRNAGMCAFCPINKHKIGATPSINMDVKVMNLESKRLDRTKLPSKESLVANDPLKA